MRKFTSSVFFWGWLILFLGMSLTMIWLYAGHIRWGPGMGYLWDKLLMWFGASEQSYKLIDIDNTARPVLNPARDGLSILALLVIIPASASIVLVLVLFISSLWRLDKNRRDNERVIFEQQNQHKTDLIAQGNQLRQIDDIIQTLAQESRRLAHNFAKAKADLETLPESIAALAFEINRLRAEIADIGALAKAAIVDLNADASIEFSILGDDEPDKE